MSQLKQFIREHGEKLLRLAFTYVKSKEVAEDIVQDILLKELSSFRERRKIL
ncbi:sigma factor [Bacillus ndiopicus]|uniref:sigma factor n=1 Tax=Bacillus ndiopicus TaxID=1347368 RepID=UPI0009DEE21E|nr:sigma factor [Bacillus ndiopicus]